MKKLSICVALFSIFLFAPVGSAAPLASTLKDQQNVAMTIYNSNIGLVKDTRLIDLKSGIQELKFMDVAAKIDPTTVHIKSLVNGSTLDIREQNYEYDLLSPQKLLEKFVGQKVHLAVFNQETKKEESVEDPIDHTPKDERFKIKIGEAFDVVGERVQTDYKHLGYNLYEVAFEVSLRNHKEEDIKVLVEEPIPGDWEMFSSTHPFQKLSAFLIRFEVPVAKDKEVTAKYRIRFRY